MCVLCSVTNTKFIKMQHANAHATRHALRRLISKYCINSEKAGPGLMCLPQNVISLVEIGLMLDSPFARLLVTCSFCHLHFPDFQAFLPSRLFVFNLENYKESYIVYRKVFLQYTRAKM